MSSVCFRNNFPKRALEVKECRSCGIRYEEITKEEASQLIEPNFISSAWCNDFIQCSTCGALYKIVEENLPISEFGKFPVSTL